MKNVDNKPKWVYNYRDFRRLLKSLFMIQKRDKKWEKKGEIK